MVPPHGNTPWRIPVRCGVKTIAVVTNFKTRCFSACFPVSSNPIDLGVDMGVNEWDMQMLTDAKIRKLKSKNTGTIKVTDSGGLQVWVYPSGTKSFKIKYRFNKKEQTDTVGHYPSVTLAEARRRRDEIKRQLALGLDPSLEKKKVKRNLAIKTENTFNYLAESYLTKLQMHRPPRAPATIKKNTSLLAEASREFGHMPMADIETSTIAVLIQGRINSGHYETASRLRTVIGSVFRHAINKGVIKYDPTLALKGLVPQFEVKHRAAITEMADLGKLLVSVDNDTGHATTKIALKLLILFALRPKELRGAKWAEFDFDKKEFRIPKERMKARKPHTIMLSEYAIDLLDELKDITGWSEYLFPSQGKKHAFMSENTLNQTLRRIGYKSGIVSAHGFRTTFTTNANESNLWSPDAVERYCARGDTNPIRGIYNRGGYLEERARLAEWWSKQVLAARDLAMDENANTRV